MIFGAIYAAVTGRDGRWPGARRRHLKSNPRCVWCGGKAETVHHVVPYHEDKTKELDPDNFASTCKRCHFTVGHECDWRDVNRNFWACVKINDKGKQQGVKQMSSQFPGQVGKTFVKADPEPVPQPQPQPSQSFHIEIGPSLKTVLIALIAVLMVLAEAYSIYLNRETKAQVEDAKVNAVEARSEATRALIQGEKNGLRLKKINDDKLKEENKHRSMIGLPPVKSEFDNE